MALVSTMGCGASEPPAGAPSSDRAAYVSNDANRRPPTGSALPAGHTIPGLLDDLNNGAVQSGDALQLPPDDDLDDWVRRVADPQLTPAGFATALQQAVAMSSQFRVPVLQDARVVVAYEPERARWRDESYYPSGIQELRQRGARIYCAAREAQRLVPDATHRMGKKSLISFRILGRQVDLLTFEPSVALGAPQKFSAITPDGAQAFVIPFKVGTKFTPVSFIPGMSQENEQWVYFITADAASLNQSSNGPMLHTATHADAFTGSGGELSSSYRIPLFTFPFGTIDLSLAYRWGQAACSQSATYEGCQSSPRPPVRRLLGSAAPGYPGQRRGGPTSDAIMVDGLEFGTVDDAPWNQLENGAFITTSAAVAAPLAFPQPMYRRALQNNDKSFEVKTQVGVSAGGVLGIGANWGPFKVGLDFGVELVSNVFTTHRFREQLNGLRYQVQPPPPEEFPFSYVLPQTDFSVTPDLSGDLGIQMNLVLHLEIDLPVVGRIGIERPLVNAGASASLRATNVPSSGWPEQHRLRLGTALTWDGTLATEGLVSHFPFGQVFPAQPQTLEACLSALPPEQLPNVMPRSCAPDPQPSAPGGIPVSLCFAAPLPTDVVGPCEGRKVTFAQQGRSSTQVIDGVQHAVRVLDVNETYQLADVMNFCQEEITTAERMTRAFEQYFFLCDSSGVAYKPDNVMQQLPEAPVQPPSPCL